MQGHDLKEIEKNSKSQITKNGQRPSDTEVYQLTFTPAFNAQNQTTFHAKLFFMNLILKTLQSVSVYTKIFQFMFFEFEGFTVYHLQNWMELKLL